MSGRAETNAACPGSATGSTTRGERVVWIALQATLPLLIYFDATRGYFANDDRAHIARLLAAPWNPFINDDPFHFFRPILRLSFAIDYWMWGLEPFGYVLTNLLTHVLNGFLAAAVVARFAGDVRVAYLAALLFAAHPLHGSSVAWISDRTDLLCTTFCLAAAWSYASYRRCRTVTRLVAVVVWFALALGTKEKAISFPLLLIALDRLSFSERPPSWRSTLRMIVPFGAVLLAYFAIRRWALGGFLVAYAPEYRVPVPWRFPIYLLQGASQVLVPFDLPGANLLRRCLKAAALAGVAIFPGRQWLECASLRRTLAFSAAWFVVTMLPESPIGENWAPGGERFLYLPSLGPCAILAALILWRRRPEEGGRFLRLLIASVVLVDFGILAHMRSGVWVSHTSLIRAIAHQLAEVRGLRPRDAVFVFDDWVDSARPPDLERSVYWNLQKLKPPFLALDLDLNPDLHGRPLGDFRTFLWNDAEQRLLPQDNPVSRAVSRELPSWRGLEGWTRTVVEQGGERRLAFVSPPLELSSVLATGLEIRLSYTHSGTWTQQIAFPVWEWLYGSPTWTLYWTSDADDWQRGSAGKSTIPLRTGAQWGSFCFFDSYRWFSSGVVRRLLLVPPPLSSGVSFAVDEARVVERGFPCG